MTDKPRIAAVTGATNDQAQALLAASVAEWRAAGARVVGVIAEGHGLPDRTCRAGVLRDIATGARFTMYLQTPPAHTACHLDATGVEAACAALIEQVRAADLVVLSKFGKLEAAGGGLAPAFRAAAEAGKPVLTSVSGKQRDAWQVFVPGAAELAPDGRALADWWQAVGRTPSEAA